MATGKVALIVVGVAFGALFGGCALLLASIHTIDLSKDLNFGEIHINFPKIDLSGIDLFPSATKQELATAATTVPPTHADCVAFRRVADAGTVVGKVNFGANTGSNFASYRDRLSRGLITYDVGLRAAIAAARGPLRAHLVQAERAVLAGLTRIRRATAPTDYDPARESLKGYEELRIAQQLLRSRCGGRLAPRVDEALLK